MCKLLETAELLNRVSEVKGKLEKQRILRSCIGTDIEDTVKKVLYYTYDINKVYGVGKKVIKEIMNMECSDEVSSNFNGNIFDFLDYLALQNMNNDIKKEIRCVFDYIGDANIIDMICKILLKDMRIGMAEKSINEVFDGLIVTRDIMLAKKFEDRIGKFKEGEKFIVTPKLDGIRVLVINEPDNIKLITRQGKLIEDCIELEEEVKKLPHNVYDGELLAENLEGLNSDDLFRKTTKITGKKGIKTGLEFHVFDMISVDDFKNKTNDTIASARKTFLKDCINSSDVKLIKCVPIFAITNKIDEIKELLDKATSNGLEGLMLNTIDGFYDFKRSNNLLKVKKFYDADLEIIGFEEGAGRNEGRLGALIVNYKGNKVNVGSGFKDEERKGFWIYRNDLIGKIVQVSYFEESKNQDGGISLRFPTFVRLRDDKSEPSYN